MAFLDRISERVGGFLDEVFLPEEVAQSLQKASRKMQREEYDAALRVLYRTHADHPDFHRTHYLIGLCQFHKGNFDKALSALNRAIGQREDAVSHLYAGLAAEQLDRFHDAQVHLRRGLDLSEGSDSQFDLLFALGRVYLEQGRADKAVRELKKAVRHRPDEPSAAVALVEALVERSKLDEAGAILETDAAEAAGFEADVLRGKLEEARHRPRRAQHAYQDALDRQPDEQAALIGAGRTSLAVGAHQQANDYLLRALDGAPDDERPEIHTLLGQTHLAVDNRRRALECFRVALELDPTDDQAHLGAGSILVEHALGGGHEHEALVEPTGACAGRGHFQAVLDSGAAAPAIRRQAQIGLARLHLADDDLAGARRLIDEVIQDEPSPAALHLRGQIARRAGDAAEAVVAFEEAIHAAGQSPGDSDRSEAVEADLRQSLDQLTFAWDLPDQLDDSTDVLAVIHQLRDFVAADPRTDHFVPRVQQMLTTVNSPLSIAIVGEFNVGKSTLLNAIIGEEVVPMGVLPTTAHTCFIQYGPRKAARIAHRDGTVREVTLDQARHQMKTDADGIDHLEFVYPHPRLRSVQFWDTPGFNALQDSHQDTASRALDQAEAILWVLDANQALSATEFDLIETVPNGRERLVVLLNKVDRIGADTPDDQTAQINQLIDYVETNAAGYIAGCFPLSATRALAERVGPSERNRADPSRFDAFDQFVESHIIERSGRIKTLQITRQLADVVDDLAAVQAKLIDKYESLGHRASDLKEWLDDQANQRPDQRVRHEARGLEDGFDFVVTGIEREVREAAHPQGAWLRRDTLTGEDISFILELLEERLDGVLDRARRSVLTEVDELEAQIAQHIGPIAEQLPLSDARALNRRMDGFFDEARMLEVLLEERVFGQLRARATGKIEAGGRQILQDVSAAGPTDPTGWKSALRKLLPDTRSYLSDELAGWYREFFLAAHRFSDRVQRDLHLLKIEAEHHFDVSALGELTRV